MSKQIQGRSVNPTSMIITLFWLNLWHPRLNLILLLFQTCTLYHLNTPIIMPHQDIMLSITLHYHKSTPVRGHNTGPLLLEHLRDPSLRILHHCETLYVPPHHRWPHIPSPSPPPPQNSEELRLVSEVQTWDLTLEVNSKLLPTCSIVWL